MMSPESEPTSRPPKVAVTALERCEPGTPLASTPVAAEGATPSPRPTRKRETRSAVKENCAQTGRDEGAEGPEHDSGEEYELAAVLLREPAAGDLREGVAPEERGLHQALLHGGPAERGGHGHDRDGHVHLVQVAQHERHEEREDHGPALLLAALGHVEAHVLRDGVRLHGAAAARAGNDGRRARGPRARRSRRAPRGKPPRHARSHPWPRTCRRRSSRPESRRSARCEWNGARRRAHR